MANLQTCSRCKSETDVSFFGLNRKKQPYKTCDNCRSNSMKTSKIKQVEQHYKFKIQGISKIRESNKDNATDDCCPTCYQGNYRQHMSCLPPDCLRCHIFVCNRCGILDNLNSSEANGFYCIDCYKPSLIRID